MSSGEPSSSATTGEGKDSSAKPAPGSITAFTVCRAFMDPRKFPKSPPQAVRREGAA